MGYSGAVSPDPTLRWTFSNWSFVLNAQSQPAVHCDQCHPFSVLWPCLHPAFHLPSPGGWQSLLDVSLNPSSNHSPFNPELPNPPPPAFPSLSPSRERVTGGIASKTCSGACLGSRHRWDRQGTHRRHMKRNEYTSRDADRHTQPPVTSSVGAPCENSPGLLPTC